MVSSRTLAETFLELSKKPYAEAGIEKFLAYVASNNLMGLLPQAIEYIEFFDKNQKNYDTLYVTTRFPLEAVELTEVKKITKADIAEVQQHIDESVIGGFSAAYQGKLYDGSLENQVTRLRSMLLR